MDTLATPVTASDGPAKLMVGAMWSLLDAYDRKLAREKYEEVVNGGVKLIQLCARLSLCDTMQKMHFQGQLTPEKIQEAISDLASRAQGEQKMLLKKMEMVVQCPWEGDPIN